MTTTTYTCIAMERSDGYHDPLIYTVLVETIDDIEDAVLEARLEEIGEEWRDYMKANLEVVLVFEGDFPLVLDRRT